MKRLSASSITDTTQRSLDPALARGRRPTPAAQNFTHDERRGRGEKHHADGRPRLHQGVALIRHPDHREREDGTRHDGDDADRVTDLVQVGEVHGISSSSLTGTHHAPAVTSCPCKTCAAPAAHYPEADASAKRR